MVIAVGVEVVMYENVSGGWNETNISYVVVTPWSVSIGDANNDGSKEIVIGIHLGVSYKVRMYELFSNPSSCGSLTQGLSLIHI